MNIEVSRVEVSDIMPLRELYRQEMNCQIIHDSFVRMAVARLTALSVER